MNKGATSGRRGARPARREERAYRAYVPIVNATAEAIDCSMCTNMDVLSIGSFVAKKSASMKSAAGQAVAGEMAS